MKDESFMEFNINDICYYFDSKNQNLYDRNFNSRRSEKMSQIQNKMLVLSDKEFEFCYRAIDKVLGQNPNNNAKDNENSKDDRYQKSLQSLIQR